MVATATASGLQCTWKQHFNYTMRSCSFTVHAHLSLALQVAFVEVSVYVYILNIGDQCREGQGTYTNPYGYSKFFMGFLRAYEFSVYSSFEFSPLTNVIYS